jgi:drug/metabolite transporter (DMT)-like permease
MTGDNLKAIAAMTAAMLFFTAGDAMMKLAGQTMPIGEMLLVRGLVASGLVLVLAWHTGVLGRWREVTTALVLWRTLAEIASTVLFFLALMSMTLADAAAIGQFCPIAIMAGAALFLGEKVGWRRWTAAGVGLLGVMLVIKPGTSAFQLPALLMLVCMLIVAARDLVTRRLPAGTPTVLVTASAIVGVTVSGALMAPLEARWHWLSPGELALLTACAITVIVGFLCVIWAMRRGDIGVVSPFRYSYVVFATAIGFAVLGEVPDAWTIAGIALIVGAGLYTFHRERVRRREAATTAASREKALVG